jgi:hypothetical protein
MWVLFVCFEVDFFLYFRCKTWVSGFVCWGLV